VSVRIARVQVDRLRARGHAGYDVSGELSDREGDGGVVLLRQGTVEGCLQENGAPSD